MHRPDPINFLGWNVDKARREEVHESTKWDTRSPHVKDFIKRCDCDIFAVVELRNLPTSKETVGDFCHHFDDEYDHEVRAYCEHTQTFYMALFFKRAEFFLETTEWHNYKGTPQNDKGIMLCHLKDKTSQRKFVIGVTHYSLDEAEKLAATQIQHMLMREINVPFVVYGDYNYFEDLDGKTHRQILLNGFKDLAWPLQAPPKIQPLSGTFIGYAHDDHKRKFDDMSRLDHMPSFGFETSTAITPFLETFKMDNSSAETIDYPSDHLAIAVQLRFDW